MDFESAKKLKTEGKFYGEGEKKGEKSSQYEEVGHSFIRHLPPLSTRVS
jgi:hypothetical protein